MWPASSIYPGSERNSSERIFRYCDRGLPGFVITTFFTTVSDTGLCHYYDLLDPL
jgi:hypothetical protein